MGQGVIAGASRPSRRLVLSSVAAWLILALVLPLSALTLNVFHFAGFPLGFWIAAQGGFIGLTALVFVYAWRAGGERAKEGLFPALVFAGEAVGAVTIIGFTGYIAAIGYDGLALPLGLVAGMALLAIAVAPRFVLYPVRSLSGFFAVRFGGAVACRLALIVSALAAILLLAANLKAGALALQALTDIGAPAAIVVLALAVCAVWAASCVIALKKLAGPAFILVVGGLLATLVAVALTVSGTAVPHLALGSALQDHAKLNQSLILNRFSDFESLTPMASPFLQLTMRNFAGLLVAVALGIVSAPYLLGRHVSQAAVAPGGAVRRTALALAAVALVAISLPPLAVYNRIGVAEAVAKGMETAAIPEPLADESRLGWVKVCGQSGSPAELAAVCANMPEQRGFLRLQDIRFTTDSFVVAAPAVSGVASYWQYPLLFGVLLGTLIVGNALIAGLVDADGEIRMNHSSQPARFDYRSAVLGFGLLLAAVIVATNTATAAGLLAAQGFAILAAGIFPALILGLYWRQMNAAGAVAAMIAGFFVAALYLLGLHLWPVEFFRITGTLSDAAPEALERFSELDAALQAATDPASRDAAKALLELHAEAIANWGGLKPAAIVLLAVPVGLLSAIAASIASNRGKRLLGFLSLRAGRRVA